MCWCSWFYPKVSSFRGYFWSRCLEVGDACFGRSIAKSGQYPGAMKRLQGLLDLWLMLLRVRPWITRCCMVRCASESFRGSAGH